MKKSEVKTIEEIQREAMLARALSDKISTLCGLEVYQVTSELRPIGSHTKKFISHTRVNLNGIGILIGYWNDRGEFIAFQSYGSLYRSKDVTLKLQELDDREMEVLAQVHFRDKQVSIHNSPQYTLAGNMSMYLLVSTKDNPIKMVETRNVVEAINQGYFDKHLPVTPSNVKGIDTIDVVVPWQDFLDVMEAYYINAAKKQWDKEEEYFSDKNKIKTIEEIEFVFKEEPSYASVTMLDVNGKKKRVFFPVKWEPKLIILELLSQGELDEFVKGYKKVLHEHSIDYNELVRMKRKKIPEA